MAGICLVGESEEKREELEVAAGVHLAYSIPGSGGPPGQQLHEEEDEVRHAHMT